MKDIEKETPQIETTPGSLNGHEGANGNGLARELSSAELATMRPRRNRLPIVIPVVLVLLLASGAVWWFFLRPGEASPTATVRRDTIISTVETTGKLEAESTARLSFKVPGRVAQVNAKQGDRVEQGDVLAVLDVENLERQLAEARTELEISKLKLQQAKEGARPEDIQAAAADLNAATARLNNVRGGSRSEDIAAAQAVLNQAQAKYDALAAGPSEQDIAQAEATLRQAQAKLDQVKAPATPDQIAQSEAAVREAQAKYDALAAGPSEQDIAAAQAAVDQATAARTQTAATASNAKEQARLAMVQASNALQNAQDVYGKIKYDNSQVSPEDLNDDDRSRESKALRDVQDAEARVEQAQLDYEAAKQTEIAQVAAADAKVREAQSALDKLKAGPTTQDLAAAQAGVDQAKAALADLRAGGSPAAVTAAQADVDGAQAALDKVKAGPTAEEMRVAEEEVKQARAALDKARAGATPDEIREAEAGVAAAQAALDKANAGPTGTDVAILEQQIALAQLAVDRAQAQVGDARLLSPLSGTLLAIDLEAGENVNAQQAVATVADVDNLRVKADVDEIDVGRVTAGMPVTVTLDAYPGVKMAGRIESIDPGATQKQGSTVYRATIGFTPGEGVIPREGMAANVDITAKRKGGVLILPNRAFETVGTRQYVTLNTEGRPKVEVETGLTNSTDTEVISGLEEGQIVLIR